MVRVGNVWTKPEWPFKPNVVQVCTSGRELNHELPEVESERSIPEFDVAKPGHSALRASYTAPIETSVAFVALGTVIDV